MRPVFLRAEWRNPILANYAVEPAFLEKHLPAKTEVDDWKGKCHVSLVGFLFLKISVLGVPILFHRKFEEVNLRFYVRFKDGGEWKRGTVFIKEIVRKPLITFAANALYGEHYQTLPTRHRWENVGTPALRASYEWKHGNRWNFLRASAAGSPQPMQAGSEEEFFTEHYWGCTKLDERRTAVYQVEHPRWRVFPVKDFEIKAGGERLYGKPFGEILMGEPQSVFLAEGSEVAVRMYRTL